MTLVEARRWADYVARHGSLNVSRHIERGFALLGHLICVGTKTKIDGTTPTMQSLMPHFVEPPITLDHAMKNWV